MDNLAASAVLKPKSEIGFRRNNSVGSRSEISYKVVKTAQSKENIRTFFSTMKKKNYIDYEVNAKKWVPPMNKYIKQHNWKHDNSRNNFQKFLQGDRVTEIDNILKKKKLKLPGPSTYKPKS